MSEVKSSTSTDRKSSLRDLNNKKVAQTKIDYLKLDENVILEEPDREGSSQISPQLSPKSSRKSSFKGFELHAIKEETDQGSLALDSEEKIKAKKRKYNLSKQQNEEDSASLHTS